MKHLDISKPTPTPLGNPEPEITPHASESLAHQTLVCAALAKGESVLENLPLLQGGQRGSASSPSGKPQGGGQHHPTAGTLWSKSPVAG